jgi:uncharacterized protein YhaN
MAAPRKRSLAHRKSRWSLVVDNSHLILEDMPHVQPDIDELKALEKEILALSAKQARYNAKLREMNQKIRALAKKADNLRSRIGASVRGKYGFSHARLIQLGFKPHRGGLKLERELAALSASGETVPGDAPPSEEDLVSG